MSIYQLWGEGQTGISDIYCHQERSTRLAGLFGFWRQHRPDLGMKFAWSHSPGKLVISHFWWEFKEQALLRIQTTVGASLTPVPHDSATPVAHELSVITSGLVYGAFGGTLSMKYHADPWDSRVNHGLFCRKPFSFETQLHLNTGPRKTNWPWATEFPCNLNCSS